jgi:acetyl esterase/lipase
MIIDHQEKKSKKMALIMFLLSMAAKISRKKLWAFVINKRNRFIPPFRKFQSDVFELDEVKVIRFAQPKETNKFVVYFHGGGFVMSGNRRHHHFIINLCKASDHVVYYVDYPLAPEYKACATLDILENLIKKIQIKEPNKEMILMGDSAGGNLALVLSKRFPKVKSIVLYSPWLDLTMTNPKIVEMEKQETMFSKNDLLKAAKDYQGKLDLDNVLVSPIYDDFSENRILICAGTADLLFPDMLKFTNNNKNVTLHEFHGLYHDFMFLLGCKEQMQVILETKKFLEYDN